MTNHESIGNAMVLMNGGDDDGYYDDNDGNSGAGDVMGVISLCLWGISPTDSASFTHHFASFTHQI